MSEFKKYRLKSVFEFRPWVPGEDMANIFVSPFDRDRRSPKSGDVVIRAGERQYLVCGEYFTDNYELVDSEMFGITINGRPFKVPGPRITYEEVCALAGESTEASVLWSAVIKGVRAHGSMYSGGHSVALVQGMGFCAVVTGSA